MSFVQFFQSVLLNCEEIISRLSNRITGIFDPNSLYGSMLGGYATLLIIGVSITIICLSIRGIRSLIWGD